MDRLPSYILAGGRGSRFGSDKARALLAGRPLLDHAAEALRSHASRLVVVAERAGKYDDLGLPTIADAGLGLGPLDGLRVALTDLRPDEPWLLLAAGDLIGAQPAWIDRLLAAARDRGREVQAVAFRGDRWQPLFALYHRELLPRVTGQLAAGERALWRLLDVVEARALALPEDFCRATDVNTLAALQALRHQR